MVNVSKLKRRLNFHKVCLCWHFAVIVFVCGYVGHLVLAGDPLLGTVTAWAAFVVWQAWWGGSFNLSTMRRLQEVIDSQRRCSVIYYRY